MVTGKEEPEFVYKYLIQTWVIHEIIMFTLQYIALKRSRMENSDPTHPMDFLTGVLYHIIQNAQETPLSYKIPAALNEMVSLKRSQEVLEKHQIEEQVLAKIPYFYVYYSYMNKWQSNADIRNE